MEIVPYFAYVLAAILVTRSCAIFAARRTSQKSAGEEIMARQHVLPTRDVGLMQDTVTACLEVLRDGGVRRLTGVFALVHLALWAALVPILLAIGFVPLLRGLA